VRRLGGCVQGALEGFALAEPGAFAAAHVIRKSAFFSQELLSPLARFVQATLFFQERGIVIESFAGGGKLDDVGKERGGIIHFARLRVRVGEESGGAPVVELAVASHDALQIGNGSSEVVEAERGLGSMIESVGRIISGVDRVIEGVARLGKLLFFQVELAEFLVISRRRIIDDLSFKRLNAGTAAETFPDSTEEAGIGNDFDEDVGGSAEDSPKDDDEKPIVFRAAPKEMNDGDDLDDESPRIEEMA
jgi:hypothetical protein